jgi:hypothetical protein
MARVRWSILRVLLAAAVVIPIARIRRVPVAAMDRATRAPARTPPQTATSRDAAATKPAPVWRYNG